MTNIFTALFGGLYCASRCIADERNKTETDLVIKKHNDFKEEITKRLCVSREYEKKIRDAVLNGKNHDEICWILRKDLEFVFGKAWRNKISLPKNQYDWSALNPDSHAYWVYHLLLSLRGHIELHALNCGLISEARKTKRQILSSLAV